LREWICIACRPLSSTDVPIRRLSYKWRIRTEEATEMRFLAFVGTEGAMPAEAVAEMNRDWPVYAEMLERRGGLRLGRELRLPDEGVVTVRVRDGKTIVTDGPFAETKEYVAGLDLFEGADLEDAIELESKSPVARFLPFELRVLPEEFRLGSQLAAFSDRDDSGGTPYLLLVWADPAVIDGPAADGSLRSDCNAWQSALEEDGRFVMGGPVGTREDATTLRIEAGDPRLSRGSFIDAPSFVTAIEVIRSASLTAAAELAASHPLTRSHAIEVRPFYREDAD
jgi:hypothetical protein